MTLFGANAVWKLVVHGDELGVGDVTCFGLVVTPFFDALSRATAEQVHWLVSLFRDTLHLCYGTLLRYDNGHATRIVWSCTPVKQAFIWTCLILTVLPLWGQDARRTWLRKLWFVPLGWIAVWCINIARIAAITLVIEQHPELFEVLHTYVFKYLFYGLMFLGWLVFTERLRPVRSSSSQTAPHRCR